MLTTLRKLAVPTLLLAIALLSSCASPEKSNRDRIMFDSDDGVTVLTTTTRRATVTAIDYAKREVTLDLESGRHKTVTCGPEMQNFNQLAINDRITVISAVELAFLLRTGTSRAAHTHTRDLAPLGLKPGGILTGTVKMTARITALNLQNRQMSLTLEDGSQETITVGPHIDLSRFETGGEVAVQHTESLVVKVKGS